MKDELSFLRNKYESTERHQNKRDREYFTYVKQESKPLFELIDQWHEQTLDLLATRQMIVHEEQVHSTKENFEMLILHSYYVDIRKRRYMEMNKSCLYVFDQLLKELA